MGLSNSYKPRKSTLDFLPSTTNQQQTMKIHELIEHLARTDTNLEIHIVAADFNVGNDTYAPLDHIVHHNGVLLLGATPFMCGTEAPQELTDEPEPEPDHDDTTRCCPDCERPNQFGELCQDCTQARNESNSDVE